MSAREDLERILCMPQDAALLDAYRDEIRHEVADEIREEDMRDEDFALDNTAIDIADMIDPHTAPVPGCLSCQNEWKPT